MSIHYGQYTVPSAETFAKLGVGQPAPKMLSLSVMRKAMEYVSKVEDPSLLQYGDIPGYSEFRESLASYLTSKYGQDVNKDHLFITNGVTDALSFFCSLFTRGIVSGSTDQELGTTVFVEEPTYFLAINIFRNDFGLNVKPIPIEKDGLDVEALDRALMEDNSRKLRVLYTIPTFHNPTSYTMSHEKRTRLAELAEKHDNFVIVADEVYQLLYFSDEAKPPLPLCYYTDKAISLGSFSKILSPAYRLGWMQIPNPELMKVFTGSGQMDSSGGKSPLSQALIHGALEMNLLAPHIKLCQDFLRVNCESMALAVRDQLSDYVDFVQPTGGYFLWLHIKGKYRASELLKNYGEDVNVHFHSGIKFSAFGKCDDYLRVSFSYYDPDGLSIGIERIKCMFDKAQMVSSSIENTDDMYKDLIKVSVLGYKGRLGNMIVDCLKQTDGYHFNGGLGKDTKSFPENTNVIIDVSSPQGTIELLNYLLSTKNYIPVVIGTTGEMPHSTIVEYSKYAPISYVSNFSQGVPQFIDLLKTINKDGWNVSIEETHHTNKVDEPSGTAKSLSHALDYDGFITSIRKGDVVGEHVVTFDNSLEQLSITHKAKDRSVFAMGALHFAAWLCKQPNGYYKSMKKIKYPFQKYNGCGNDFIMINLNEVEILPKERSQFTRTHCSRGTGIGADGMIFMSNNPDYIYWEYYNSDGGSVEMCGNGARCVVKYFIDKNVIPQDDIMYNEGIRVELRNNFGISQNAIVTHDGFKVIMPKATSNYSIINDMCTRSIIIGVPHIVEIVQVNTTELLRTRLIKLAKELRDGGYTGNINVYRFNENAYKEEYDYEVLTFERGVENETLACGTGCCAVAYYLYRDQCDENLEKEGEEEREEEGGEEGGEEEEGEDKDKINEKIYRLKTASGEILNVTINSNLNIYLEGPARKVFDGWIL